ncbi:MAG: TonB-dependent receptor [Gemmatimonadota bacterium]
MAGRHAGSERPLARLAYVAVAVIGATAVPGALVAQEPVEPDTAGTDTTVFELGGIVVETARAVATVGGASAVEVSIDSLDIGPVPSMADVLRKVPLVQLRQNSRGQVFPALRGAQERQIAVLIDGVPLTLGWDHRTDLTVVPMMAASDMRMARGLPSLLTGPNVLGGVVEVSVARGPMPIEEPEPVTASLGLDHAGSSSVGAVVARRFESDGARAIARAGAGYHTRSGFVVPDAIADRAGDADGLRTNSDDERADGFVALRYRGDGGSWLSFAASGFRANRGVPPEAHVPDDDKRLWRYPELSELFAALSGGTGQVETPLGEGDLEASLGFEYGETVIDEYATPAYADIVGGEIGSDRQLTLRLLGDHTLGSRMDLSAAFTVADIRHEEAIEPTLGELHRNEYEQVLWSVGGEAAWRVGALGGLHAVRATGGLALDGAFTPRTGGHPEREPIDALGARLGLNALAGEDVRLHLGLSRRARFPSLRELYSAALGRFNPNPELGPETLNAGEAGVTVSGRSGELQLVGFHHRRSGAVVRIPNPDPGPAPFMRVNRDEIRSTGLELLGSWAADPLVFAGDLTLQRVRVHDPDAADAAAREVEYWPAVVGGLDVTARLPLELRGTAVAKYMGSQYCVVPSASEGGSELEPTTRVDMELRRSVSWDGGGPFDGVEAVVGLNNLTDTAIYDQCGLPQPGRTLRLQLRIR